MTCVDANQLKHKLCLTDGHGNIYICVIRNGAARENWTLGLTLTNSVLINIIG